MAVLEVVTGLTPGQRIPVPGQSAVLGRHPECDIVLDVGAVSRQHARIVQQASGFFVEDLKSRNGTFVNDQLIQGLHPLKHDDRLKICDLVFRFVDPTAQPSQDVFRLSSGGDAGATFTFTLEDPARGGSTIMSKVDVESTRSGLQVSVNAELKLRALLEITRNLTTALDVDAVLGKVLDSLFKIFVQADRGFIVLREPEKGHLIPKAVKHRRADNDDSIRISRTIVNQVMQSREAILSADAASDSRFDSSQSIADFRIRSMMCAPLVGVDGVAVGVIQIDALDQRSRFQQDDLEVLASVACQAAIALQNAQLHQSALEQQALARDLELAHRVQQGFLPAAPPAIPGYEFFDFYDSAKQVGGDLFDYIDLPGGRLALLLGDVSGKGISASLLMAKLSSEVRYSLARQAGPAAALNELNAGFNRPGWEDRFVTAVLAVLDVERHELTIANAGHMAPYLRRTDGRVEAIGEEFTGVPLGVAADFAYEEFRVTLGPGEALVLYTDGISEAMNAANDLYGYERIEAVLRKPHPGPKQLGHALLEDLKRYVGAHAQSDDMCLMTLGRTG